MLLEVFLSLLLYTFTLGFTKGLRKRPLISIKREIYLKNFSGFCLLFILLVSFSIQFFTFLSSDNWFQRKINFDTKTRVKNQAPKLILLISPYPIFNTI